ncbi:MarR family winged helix-turn-helix transcriptional regulator [Catenuloplanes indicus]|uniref:DNA-binding MarR family transcriptional regulator n=1 Tax=Catenuloplanes indicus TaxID=137267 RepID=A0AAE3W4U0_9ACTN|nr:helix-turn-helix domain-containing protein [Catenuloplanes indicus]MDQ0369489.1 DNA-binding MarR family transcriptional regulator [Catenuloplanes indicus]
MADSRAVLMALERMKQSHLTLHHAVARRLKINSIDAEAIAHLIADEPLTQEVLRARLLISKSAMTALVDRLVRDDFLVRHANPADRRSTLLTVSPRARHGWANGMQRVFDTMDPVAAALGPDAAAVVAEFLDRVTELQLKLADDVMRYRSEAGE